MDGNTGKIKGVFINALKDEYTSRINKTSPIDGCFKESAYISEKGIAIFLEIKLVTDIFYNGILFLFSLHQ